jgi:methylenetetrahydrofolate reductase (NADPH)
VVSLKKVVATLKEYNPLFVDVTWGAGGSTSELTFDLCKDIKQSFDLNANMHLTCTNMDKAHIDTALEKCQQHGLRNILALRGDPPAGQERWTASDSQLTCATDLVRYIRSKYEDYFSVSVAGYPEVL